MRIGGEDLRRNQPWSWTSSFRDCEEIKCLLCQWPGLWYCVVTAPSKPIRPRMDSANIYSTRSVCEALNKVSSEPLSWQTKGSCSNVTRQGWWGEKRALPHFPDPWAALGPTRENPEIHFQAMGSLNNAASLRPGVGRRGEGTGNLDTEGRGIPVPRRWRVPSGNGTI